MAPTIVPADRSGRGTICFFRTILTQKPEAFKKRFFPPQIRESLKKPAPSTKTRQRKQWNSCRMKNRTGFSFFSLPSSNEWACHNDNSRTALLGENNNQKNRGKRLETFLRYVSFCLAATTVRLKNIETPRTYYTTLERKCWDRFVFVFKCRKHYFHFHPQRWYFRTKPG